ncbi:hydroxyisourate hydrolase [Mycolicibacterium mengxianglii]|uniref:hydroxyisourate hydrolase n=1 Tax=Mycolicibacterium mengxianglii TaxID=2736649 RepID=UPI0018D034A7|nr:hydroxyisourate hydrolase [Mycolicibacterium mengxianglii]
MTHVSTHVLNAVTGRPAAGVAVTLTDTTGTLIAQATTDENGRVTSLTDDSLTGVYRLMFDTASYFAAQAVVGFYPEVLISFEITDPAGRYHVPLLLSPYAYSTYRGS